MEDDEEEAIKLAIRESLLYAKGGNEGQHNDEEELMLALRLSQQEEELRKQNREAEEAAREQAKKQEQEAAQRQKKREKVPKEDEDVVEIVPVSVLDLTLLSSNFDLMERILLGTEVSVDYPAQLNEDGSDCFVVLTGSDADRVARAKKILFEGVRAAAIDLIEPEFRAGSRKPPSRKNIRNLGDCDTYIFVDSSNILIGGNQQGISIDISKFCRFIERDRRPIVERFAVGSPVAGFKNLDKLWAEEKYVARGFLGRGGPEELQDAVLQGLACRPIYARAMDLLAKRDVRPSAIVLCTGDGNYDDLDVGAESFPKVVNRALELKFNVVMFCWRVGCSRKYKQIEHPNFELIFLEDFKHEISK